MTLSEGKKGARYIVKEVRGEGNQKRRLLELGFTPHTRVEINTIAPFGKTIMVGLYGYLLGLRKEAADLIVVEQEGA